MKVLIFGNSHAACIVDAARSNPDFKNMNFKFLVQSGRGPMDFSLTSGRLVARGENLIQSLKRLSLEITLDLEDFDAFAIVGCEVSIFTVIHILNKYHVIGWPKSRRIHLPSLTESVLRLAVSEAISSSSGVDIMNTLRRSPSLKGKKLLVLPQPFPSERVLSNTGHGIGFRRLVQKKSGHLAVKVFHDELTSICKNLDAECLYQVNETINESCLTRENFCVSANRLFNLKRKQPVDDILHTNVHYGELLIEQIAAAVERHLDFDPYRDRAASNPSSSCLDSNSIGKPTSFRE